MGGLKILLCSMLMLTSPFPMLHRHVGPDKILSVGLVAALLTHVLVCNWNRNVGMGCTKKDKIQFGYNF